MFLVTQVSPAPTTHIRCPPVGPSQIVAHWSRAELLSRQLFVGYDHPEMIIMTMSAGGSLDLYFLNLCIFVNKQIIYALLLQNMSPRFSQFFKGKKPNPLMLDLVGVYIVAGWEFWGNVPNWIFGYLDILISNWGQIGMVKMKTWGCLACRASNGSYWGIGRICKSVQNSAITLPDKDD